MKPKTMILMGLAIVCGLGASYMTSRLLADRGDTEKETVKILVAKRALNIGERIAKPEEMFEEKMILKDADTPDSIRDFEALKGKILKQGRNKGDAITPANIFNEKDGLEIPKGHQAVGLSVNLETNAHGFASLPHSRVDLHWFQRGDKNETSRTDVLLQDVLVLAADGKIDRDGLTAVAQIVILALTPDQVVRVNLAKQTGVISLSSRMLDDKDRPSIVGLTGEELRKEIADRNKTAKKNEDVYAGPPSEGAKATSNLPALASKKSMDAPQAAADPQRKTTRQEYSVFQSGRVEHIVREIDEEGRIVSEIRTITDLGVPQAPPVPQKKQSLEISVVN